MDNLTKEAMEKMVAQNALKEIEEARMQAEFQARIPKTGAELAKMEAQKTRKWALLLDDRQRAELEFCEIYAKKPFGTSGHNEKVLIAKLAAILDQYETASGTSE